MAHPEQLPESASEGDDGHVDDHNLITTAIGNIDDRVYVLETAPGGGAGAVEIAKQGSQPDSSLYSMWLDTDDVSTSSAFTGPMGPPGPVGASGPFAFPEWQPGVNYSVGDTVFHNGGLWRCHTPDPLNGYSPFPEVKYSHRVKLESGQTWSFAGMPTVQNGDKIVVLITGEKSSTAEFNISGMVKSNILGMSFDGATASWVGSEIFYKDVTNINVTTAPTLSFASGVTSTRGISVTALVLRHAALGGPVSSGSYLSNTDRNITVYGTNQGVLQPGSFTVFGDTPAVTIADTGLMVASEMVNLRKYTGAIPAQTIAATTNNNNHEGLAFTKVAGPEIDAPLYPFRLNAPKTVEGHYFLHDTTFVNSFHQRTIANVAFSSINRLQAISDRAPRITLGGASLDDAWTIPTVGRIRRVHAVFAGDSTKVQFSVLHWTLISSPSDGAGEIPIDGELFITAGGANTLNVNLATSHKLNLYIDRSKKVTRLQLKTPPAPSVNHATCSLNISQENVADNYQATMVVVGDWGTYAVTPNLVRWAAGKNASGQISFRWNATISKWEAYRASGAFSISTMESILHTSPAPGGVAHPPILVPPSFYALEGSAGGGSVANFYVAIHQIIGKEAFKRVYERGNVTYYNWANKYPGGTFTTGLYSMGSAPPTEMILTVFNDNYSPSINFCNIFLHEMGHLLDLSSRYLYSIDGSTECWNDYADPGVARLVLNQHRKIWDIWLKTSVMSLAPNIYPEDQLIIDAATPGFTGIATWTPDTKYRCTVKKLSDPNNNNSSWTPATWEECVNDHPNVVGNSPNQTTCAEFVAECFSLWMAIEVLPNTFIPPHNSYPEPLTLDNQFTTHSLRSRVKALVPPQYPTLLLDMFAIFEQIDWIEEAYKP